MLPAAPLGGAALNRPPETGEPAEGHAFTEKANDIKSSGCVRVRA